jgi:hypothetical protein
MDEIKSAIMCHHFSTDGCMLCITDCTNCKEFVLAGVFQMRSKDVPVLRDSILKQQGGLCAILGVELTGDSSACLDHHHQKKNKGTGRIRGVLGRAANTFLAKVENNATRYGVTATELPKVLRSMADYLEAEQYPYMHPTEKPKVPKLTKTSFNRLVKAMRTSGVKKFPVYPSSGKLTVPLQKLFAVFNVTPEYYGK